MISKTTRIQIIKILFLVSLTLTKIKCETEYLCINHPGLEGIQRLVLEQKKQNEQLFMKLSVQLTTFDDKLASIKQASDLRMCSQYAGQYTCCDSNLVTLLEELVYTQYQSIMQSNTFFTQVLQNLPFSIQSCGSKYDYTAYTQNASSNSNADNANAENYNYNDYNGNDELRKEVERFNCKQNECLSNLIKKGIIPYYRGQVCSICAGLDNITQYFAGNDYAQLNNNNFEIYMNNLIESVSCIDELRTAFPKIVDSIFQETSDQSKDCENVQNAYNKMFTDNFNYPCQGNTCNDTCTSQVSFFGENQNCHSNVFVEDNIQNQIQQIQSNGFYSRSNNNKNRLLANTTNKNIDNPNNVSNDNADVAHKNNNNSSADVANKNSKGNNDIDNKNNNSNDKNIINNDFKMNDKKQRQLLTSKLTMKKQNFFLSENGGIKSYILDEEQDKRLIIEGTVCLLSYILSIHYILYTFIILFIF